MNGPALWSPAATVLINSQETSSARWALKRLMFKTPLADRDRDQLLFREE